MRYAFISSLIALLLIRPVAAQDWVVFSSPEDGFKVNFPTQPQVQNTPYTSEFDYRLPQKIFTASSGQQRFSVAVIDYRGIHQLGLERAKTCTAGDERCRGAEGATTGAGYWRQDLRGAMVHAIFTFIQRNAKIDALSWDWADRIEGTQMQLTNADKSHTSVAISMNQNRLYIVEATAPAAFPPPKLFPEGFRHIDRDGKVVRYKKFYWNAVHGPDGDYPPPDREEKITDDNQ